MLPIELVTYRFSVVPASVDVKNDMGALDNTVLATMLVIFLLALTVLWC